MIRAELLKEWVNGLDNDAFIGIDDGRLALATEDGQALLEVGGFPSDLCCVCNEETGLCCHHHPDITVCANCNCPKCAKECKHEAD